MLRFRIQRTTFSVVCAATSLVSAATLNFEGLPVGTRFGQQYGQTPGQIVHSQNGIDMSVENFFFSSQGFTGFARAEVGGGGLRAYFPSEPLFLDNLNVRFDLTGVGFNVDRVSVDYLELGGLDNFAVNDRPIIEITPLNGLPIDIAPGIRLYHDVLDGITGLSRITLVGDVDSLLIGGQELGINVVVAVPEPAGLALMGAAMTPLAWRLTRSKRRSR